MDTEKYIELKKRYCQKYTERACSGYPIWGPIRMRSSTAHC